MDPLRIADRARDSISDYCINSCKAYCCRKGYLVLTKKEAKLIAKDLDSDCLKKNGEDKYSLKLPCPALEDFKCRIYKSKNRPTVCREFPLFLEGKTIRVSNRCPACREGMLYPYVKELIASGYTLMPDK